MTLNKVLPALVVASFFVTLSSVRAELATDSPVFLTGSIASASATTVILKLEDGRSERKIPRKFFPASTDFFPGRIVTLKVTDELRAVISPDAKPRDLTDSELVNLIHTMQRGIGQKRTDQGESAEFVAPTPVLDFFTIRSAYSAPSGCAPFSEFGMILKSRDTTGKCVYERAAVCSSGKLDSALRQCNPLLYGNGENGSGLCKSESSKGDSCGNQFADSCKRANVSGAENVKACIQKLVVPYVKNHRDEFKKLAASLSSVCAEKSDTAIADPSLCGLDSQDRKNIGVIQGSLLTASQSVCVLAVNDPLNADVTDQVDQAKIVKAPAGCGAGAPQVVIREVKCQDGTSRFATCREGKSHSAKACLEDRISTGNSARSEISQKTKASQGAQPAR